MAKAINREFGMRVILDAIVAQWWSIFLFLFGGAASGVALLRKWNRRNEARHAALETRQNVFDARLDEALKSSTARHEEDVASCDRCRKDFVERFLRADAWVREDSQHHWAATNNLIQKMESIAQGVARIEGLLEARRIADRDAAGR